MINEQRNIVFFDGECNFCNSSVNFIFEHRKSDDIYFASLQSDFAKSVLPESFYSQPEFDTIYFFRKGKIYDRASAILRIAKSLKIPYSFVSVFLLIPKFISDFLYDLVAKNRHKIVKNKVTCRLATPEEKKFFLDTASSSNS